MALPVSRKPARQPTHTYERGLSPCPYRLVHWDELLAGELGDADRALVVRLVGDGLLLNAISGTPLAQERVAALVDHLVSRPR